MKKVHTQQHGGHDQVILAPHVTEKASALNEKHVYTFDVDLRAGKRDVIKAIQSLYGVKVDAIRMLRSRGKERTVKGKIGRRAAQKKAYVTVPEGTTIDLG